MNHHHLLLFLVFLSVTGPLFAAAPVAPPPSHVPAHPGSLPGVGNFGQVEPWLYRGAQPTAEGYASLKKMGIKTVINFRRFHGEQAAVEAAGMTAISIPLIAGLTGSEPPTPVQISQFFGLLTDPARRPIFIHCAHGQDRTGTMAAIWRIQSDGWTNTEAIAEMDAFGFNRIWRNLLNFVQTYRPVDNSGRLRPAAGEAPSR